MLRLFILLSFIAHLAPEYVSLIDPDSIEFAKPNLDTSLSIDELLVEFSAAPAVSIGTPVLLRGQLVGSVQSLQVEGEYGLNAVISLASQQDADLRDGATAVVSTVWLTKEKRAESFIELHSPANGEPLAADKISGFTTYEDFWRNSEAEVLVESVENTLL